MMQEKIEKKVLERFPEALYRSVDNESHGHQVPQGSETHFKVCVVDAAFEGMNRVRRHQLIYQLLAEELTQGVHALALHLHTPQEWQGQAPQSPPCQHAR